MLLKSVLLYTTLPYIEFTEKQNSKENKFLIISLKYYTGMPNYFMIKNFC